MAIVLGGLLLISAYTLPANVQAAVVGVLATFDPAVVERVAAIELVPPDALPADVGGRTFDGERLVIWVRWDLPLEPLLIHELCHAQRWIEAGDAEHSPAFWRCVAAHGGAVTAGVDG
jgi:hypothetical protein